MPGGAMPGGLMPGGAMPGGPAGGAIERPVNTASVSLIAGLVVIVVRLIM